MHRIRLALVLGVLFLAITPGSADAVSWWWLDALSGPKFDGPVFQVRLVCLAQDGAARSIPGVITSFCNLKDGKRRRASIDLNLGVLRSDPNPRFADGQPIDLTTLSASFSAHLTGAVEVGFAVGNSWFSSAGTESVQKVILEPVRLDLRPLQLLSEKQWRDGVDEWYREVFVFRAGLVLFPAGFSRTDLNGEKIGREFVFYKGFFVDAEPIIRKFLLKNWDR